jgi:hypothetical protein
MAAERALIDPEVDLARSDQLGSWISAAPEAASS